MEDKMVSLKEVLDKIYQMTLEQPNENPDDWDDGYHAGKLDVLGDLAQEYDFYEYLVNNKGVCP